jgi:hypothetical protein
MIAPRILPVNVLATEISLKALCFQEGVWRLRNTYKLTVEMLPPWQQGQGKITWNARALAIKRHTKTPFIICGMR